MLPWQTNKTFVIYFMSLQKPIKPYIMVFLRLNLCFLISYNYKTVYKLTPFYCWMV